jgi:hypothetical protein
MISKARSTRVSTVASILCAAQLLAYAPAAHAEEVSATGKGIAGGALLGAEAVVITESLIGVKPTWAYLVGGGLGAVGGGVGGYFVEQSSSDGRIPVYMLAGGLALIIPGVVLTLNATRYVPAESASEDRAPTNAPPPDPGKVGGSSVGTEAPPASTKPAATPPAPATPAPAPAPAAPAPAPTSMLDYSKTNGTLRLGLPVPQVRQAFSMQERRQYGLAPLSEVRLQVMQVTF